MAAIADAGQFVNAFFYEAVGGEHVDDFGRTRVTDGATIANEEHGIAVDG